MTRAALAAGGVDPRERAYYERLSQTWWDRSGPFWPLHRLNALRINYIRDQVCRLRGRDADAERPFEGLRIVDVGCGGGLLSEPLAELGAGVTGIDVVEKNIDVARHHAAGRQLEIHYETVTAEELARRGERYDVVLNMEVVEHVADIEPFLGACCRLVADDGVAVIATINRTAASFAAAIVGAEYVLRWLPRGTHRWNRFLRPSELETLIRRNGLLLDTCAGVRINPLTRRFSLTTSLSVNYMMVARRAQVH
jgi:2-polyprenyl-6-hydroxyphenyl methylase/3-demethylubiquinone-9 3-methyltransferase